jgi:protein gp37
MARDWWWDLTWDTTGGCTYVSPGCLHCYAARRAGTLHQAAGASRRVDDLYAETVNRVKGRYLFNGHLTELKPGDPEWKMPLRLKTRRG